MLKGFNRFPTLIQSLLNENSFQGTSWVYHINAQVIDTFWWYYSFSWFCRREFGQIYQTTFLIFGKPWERKEFTDGANTCFINWWQRKLWMRQNSLVEFTHCLRHQFSAGIHTQIPTSNNMRKRAWQIDWKVLIREERKKPFTAGVFDCFIQGTLVASLLKARTKM